MNSSHDRHYAAEDTLGFSEKIVILTGIKNDPHMKYLFSLLLLFIVFVGCSKNAPSVDTLRVSDEMLLSNTNFIAYSKLIKARRDIRQKYSIPPEIKFLETPSLSEEGKALYELHHRETKELKKSVISLSNEYYKENPQCTDVIFLVKEMMENVEYSDEVEKNMIAEVESIYDTRPNVLLGELKKEFPKIDLERIVTLALK